MKYEINLSDEEARLLVGDVAFFGPLTDKIKKQVREQAPPPPEPLGVGAVVRDGKGFIFIRFNDHEAGCNDWMQMDPSISQPTQSQGRVQTFYYRDITTPVVLSEGVRL